MFKNVFGTLAASVTIRSLYFWNLRKILRSIMRGFEKNLAPLMYRCAFLRLSEGARAIEKICLAGFACFTSKWNYCRVTGPPKNGIKNQLTLINIGKWVHRTLSSVRERQSCIGLMYSKKNWRWKRHLKTRTSVAGNFSVNGISRSKLFFTMLESIPIPP
jgi:hypothetical protein